MKGYKQEVAYDQSESLSCCQMHLWLAIQLS